MKEMQKLEAGDSDSESDSEEKEDKLDDKFGKELNEKEEKLNLTQTYSASGTVNLPCWVESVTWFKQILRIITKMDPKIKGMPSQRRRGEDILDFGHNGHPGCLIQPNDGGHCDHWGLMDE